IGLDWPGPAGDYSEAQAAAWRMDTILAKAAERGIYLQGIMLWHQCYTEYVAPPVSPPDGAPRLNTSADWNRNPYNISLGGLLSGASALFFVTARVLLNQLMPHILARWCDSPRVLPWHAMYEVASLPVYPPP